MPRPISPDHPNLARAASRLRRIQFTWAVLFAGMALLTILADPQAIPVHWIVGAAVLAYQPQPTLLGMVAVTWGLSLLGLLPGLNAVFAIDPAGALFRVGFIESLALAFVRIILMIMAWNQLLFYRMLYGMPSPGKGLSAIPEVIKNRTDRLALWAQMSLVAGALILLISLTLGPSTQLMTSAYGLATLAIGLGIGVAFSPTTRRGAVLVVVTLAALLFVLTVAASRGLAR